jgi:hypothetical protein
MKQPRTTMFVKPHTPSTKEHPGTASGIGMETSCGRRLCGAEPGTSGGRRRRRGSTSPGNSPALISFSPVKGGPGPAPTLLARPNVPAQSAHSHHLAVCFSTQPEQRGPDPHTTLYGPQRTSWRPSKNPEPTVACWSVMGMSPEPSITSAKSSVPDPLTLVQHYSDSLKDRCCDPPGRVCRILPWGSSSG